VGNVYSEEDILEVCFLSPSILCIQGNNAVRKQKIKIKNEEKKTS
jgi:hypothetical protein